MSNHTDLSLSADTPNIMLPFMLFNATPDNLHEIMAEKGCHTMRNYAVMHAIISFVKLEITEHVHGFDFPIGKTIRVSYNGIASRAGCDRRTAIRAVADLTTAGMLIKQVSPVVGMHHESNSYQIAFYTEAIDKIKKDPGLIQRKRKFQALASTEDAEAARANDAETLPDATESSSNSEPNATESLNLDLKKEENTRAPTPGPRARPRKADFVPEVEGGEDNFSNSQNPEPEPPEPPPSAALPTGVPADDRLKEKNSRKEKDVDFFHRECFSLADKFAGDDLEYTPPDLHRKHAAQFRDQLMKMFRSPALVNRYPDEGVRLARCTEALRIWIEIVHDRDKPAFSVGFLSTEVGMRALIQAKKQAMEGYADYQEIELDPAIVELSKQKWGENWKEKRKQENAKRRAGHDMV